MKTPHRDEAIEELARGDPRKTSGAKDTSTQYREVRDAGNTMSAAEIESRLHAIRAPTERDSTVPQARRRKSLGASSVDPLPLVVNGR